MIDQIIEGDCLEVMDRIPSKSIDMILCDLPYGITSCSWDSAIPFEPLWTSYERVAKENAAIILTAAEPFAAALIMSNEKLFKYDLIWKKTHPKGHLNAKRAPMRAHEQILIFYKKLPTYNPQKTAGHNRKISRAVYNRESDGNSAYGAEKRDTLYDSTERFPLSVIEISNGDQSKKLHPTQKPVKLFEYLIRTYSNPGDIVLDNCSGSGTTAEAAIVTGRRFICIEKERQYVEASKKRIRFL